MWKYLSILLLSLYSVAEASAQQPVDSIPFTVGADNRIYVHCRINDSDTLRCLFDTGATDMVLNPLSPRAASAVRYDGRVDNLGTTGSGGVRRSSSNRLCIGHQRIDSLAVLGIDYPPELWDGVVGLSFIRRYAVLIDYARQMMYLYSPGSRVAPAGAEELGVEWTHGVPVVRLCVGVNGDTYVVRTELDTGSDRILDLSTPFVNAHGLLDTQAPFAISRISSSDGGAGELRNVWFDFLTIGRRELPHIPGAFSTLTSGLLAGGAVDAMAGNNLLQRFDALLDFSNDRIWLWPNRRLWRKFYDFLP